MQPLSLRKQAEKLRLAKALRENLKRRKAQSRQRDAIPENQPDQPGAPGVQYGSLPK